jgi:hypothetical protein
MSFEGKNLRFFNQRLRLGIDGEELSKIAAQFRLPGCAAIYLKALALIFVLVEVVTDIVIIIIDDRP